VISFLLLSVSSSATSGKDEPCCTAKREWLMCGTVDASFVIVVCIQPLPVPCYAHPSRVVEDHDAAQHEHPAWACGHAVPSVMGDFWAMTQRA
jgi:hypothetical protein